MIDLVTFALVLWFVLKQQEREDENRDLFIELWNRIYDMESKMVRQKHEDLD